MEGLFCAGLGDALRRRCKGIFKINMNRTEIVHGVRVNRPDAKNGYLPGAVLQLCRIGSAVTRQNSRILVPTHDLLWHCRACDRLGPRRRWGARSA